MRDRDHGRETITYDDFEAATHRPRRINPQHASAHEQQHRLVEPPTDWERVRPWTVGAVALLAGALGCRFVYTTASNLRRAILETETIRVGSLKADLRRGGFSSTYGKLEASTFALRPEHVVRPERAPDCEAVLVRAKKFEVWSVFETTVSRDSKGRTKIQRVQKRVDRLVHEHCAGSRFVRIRAADASGGHVCIAQATLPAAVLTRVVDHYEPIERTRESAESKGLLDRLGSAARDALHSQQDRIVGYKYHEDVMPLDQPLFLLGEFHLRAVNGDGRGARHAKGDGEELVFEEPSSAEFKNQEYVLIRGTEAETLTDAAQRTRLYGIGSTLLALGGFALTAFSAYEWSRLKGRLPAWAHAAAAAAAGGSGGGDHHDHYEPAHAHDAPKH